MLVLTKGIAIEATAILANEREEGVRRVFGDDLRGRTAAFLTGPGPLPTHWVVWLSLSCLS